MPAITTVLASPLARHPSLLFRKLAQRLNLYRETGPLPEPTSTAIAIPGHLKPALADWIGRVPIRATVHSFSNVFEQDFAEAQLLELCRKGPNPGHQDLSGDIKLIWDFSRAHALFLNACNDCVAVDPSAAFIRRWFSANTDTDGPAWTCAMDVAIRAVNWIAADALCAGRLGRAVGTREWASWLWHHGLVIWRRLESKIIPSNHYLADLLGLLAVGSIFPNDRDGRKWQRFARNEFPRALLAQTRPDGGLNEASLRYHAFVTEMALVARLFHGSAFSPQAEQRLRSMCQVIANFRDASGDVFPFGDDDSGRVLGLDHASTLGRGDVLLKLAEAQFEGQFRGAEQAICPESGWYVQRCGKWTAAVEFGGVGLRGLGSHAHNDDLSVCAEWQEHPVIVDPGTYAYTWDPDARNRFRSALAHNAPVLDGQEPRTPTHHLFYLPGRDEAWKSAELSDGRRAFHRVVTNGISHRRVVHLSSSEQLGIDDEIDGSGNHRIEWHFRFHPLWKISFDGSGSLRLRNDRLQLRFDVTPADVEIVIADGEFSPGYGHIQACQTIVLRKHAALPYRCQFVLKPA